MKVNWKWLSKMAGFEVVCIGVDNLTEKDEVFLSGDILEFNGESLMHTNPYSDNEANITDTYLHRMVMNAGGLIVKE